MSAVYEVSDEGEHLVCEYATALSVNGGIVTLTDIMGKEYAVEGALKSIDLVGNTIKLEAKSTISVM
jgi:predicted RNA-binding protein